MSRLTELLALRARIDAEIEREQAAIARVASIKLEVARTLQRGNWATRSFNATCLHYDVIGDDVLGTCRERPVVAARHVAMWVMRAGGMSLSSIGREVGRDHTTVLHGIKRVETRPDLMADARTIYEALAGPIAAAS